MNRLTDAALGIRARPWAKRASQRLYFLTFLLIFLFLMWKCPYGFGNMDEAFFLAIPYRFIQGDRMLLHEWHFSQFSFFTMIPEMWLYRQIVHTTDGIILNFRYIYTVLWCLASMFLYFRSRKIHEYGARCASLFLMIFAPYGIMAFSYNSLGILYLINAAIFLLCADRYKKVQYVISGLFFAGAVLCCPYLAIIYVLYSMVLVILQIRGRNPVIPLTDTGIMICWKYFTLGICILMAFFLAFLLCGADGAALLKSFQYALQDPEHMDFSFLNKTRIYFQELSAYNPFLLPILVVIAGMTLLTRWKRKAIWFVFVAVAVILYLRKFLQVDYTSVIINYTVLPMTFMGIYIFAVTQSRNIRCISCFWLIPGILYTYCINYSSSQGLWAISLASTVSSVCSFYLMFMYCDELKVEYRNQKKKNNYWILAYLAALACFIFQMRYGIPVRYQSVYWEPGLMKYEKQQKIERGPEKGIIATVKMAENYNRLYQDVMGIDNQRVLFLSEQLWMYLVNSNENASYSAWQGSFQIERLKEYYSICPEKAPEIIYLDRESENMRSFFQYYDQELFDIMELESGNCLISPKQTEEPFG